MFLDFADVQQYCGVVTAKDAAALRDDAEVACQWVEDVAGPIGLATITEQAWSTGSYCRLASPATGIVSIDGSTDLPAISLTPGGLIAGIAPGWHTVSYTVGYATVPDWAKGAAMARTKWLWLGRSGPKAQSGGIDWRQRSEDLVASHAKGPRP